MPLTNEEALHKDIVGVKVSSWILIILGIIGVVASVILLITGPFVLGASGNSEVIEGVAEEIGSSSIEGVSVESGIAVIGVLVTIMGLVSLAVGVLDIVTGCFGLRGANDPSKINPYLILSWISLVLAIVSFIVSLIGHFSGQASAGGSIVTEIIQDSASIVFTGCCVFYGTRVKQLTSQN